MDGNRAFVNEDGIGEMILVGDQNKDSLYKAIQETLKLDDVLSASGRSIKTLVDITKMTSLDLGAVKMSERGLGNTLYDKIAVCGAINQELRDKVMKIMGAAPDESRARYFDTREEAITWLKS